MCFHFAQLLLLVYLANKSQQSASHSRANSRAECARRRAFVKHLLALWHRLWLTCCRREGTWTKLLLRWGMSCLSPSVWDRTDVFPSLGWGCIIADRLSSASPLPCIPHPSRHRWQLDQQCHHVRVSVPQKTGRRRWPALSGCAGALEKERRLHLITEGCRQDSCCKTSPSSISMGGPMLHFGKKLRHCLVFCCCTQQSFLTF